MSSKSAKAEEAPRADLPSTVSVGRILRPHGVRGELGVELLTDIPERFSPGSLLLLVLPGKVPATVEVTASRPYRGGLLVQFAGVEDREAADGFRGGMLEVERARVPEAPEGTYYHYELVGCRCRSAEGDLGRVVDLAEDGGGLLLIVSDGVRQLPVPFVARFLKKVDVRAGEIELDLPPGLVETCASGS
jgi:16S rRNA processing protein RimM